MKLQVQNALDLYKLKVKDTHIFMSGRIKLHLLPSPRLSLCNSSEAGLPYSFSAPVSHMAFPCSLAFAVLKNYVISKSGREGKLQCFPFFHTCPVVGGTTLKGFFRYCLLCSLGNSHHHLVMSSSEIAQWIWVGGVWYTVGAWISENICIQIFLVSVYIIGIASCCLDPVQYLVFKSCLNKVGVNWNKVSVFDFEHKMLLDVKSSPCPQELIWPFPVIIQH